MKRPIYYAFLVTVFLSQPCLAETAEQRIEANELQRKAETVLQSEPDARAVTVKVEVGPVNPPADNTINLEQFDINEDGILARDEVGETLFRIFDGDGNEVIDNIEMEKPRLIVLVPMQKKTVEIVDYYSPYTPEKQTVTHEQFLDQSKLGMFDKDGDGLSPLDFLEKPFNQVNVKKDIVIDLYEWKRAYAESVRPKHMENFMYN